MPGSGWRAGFAVFTALAALIVVGGPDAAQADSGGCAPGPQVTTYTSAGSPYLVGTTSAGPGDCIVIDASGGPVVLEFSADGGLYLNGGSIQTVNTSAADTVTLEPVSPSATWVGVVSPPIEAGVTTDPLVNLTNTTVVGAGVDTVAQTFTAIDDTIDGPLCDVVDYPEQSTDTDGAANVDGTTVTTSIGCYADEGAVVLNSNVDPADVSFTDSTVHVTAPGVDGVDLGAPSGVTSTDGPDASDLDITANGDDVDGVQANSPAMSIGGNFTDDPTGVGDNSGADDAVPVMSWNGNVVGDLAWPATPSDDSTPQPLGLESGSLEGFEVWQGSVSVAAGVTAAGPFDVSDGSISAPTGPTYFSGKISAEGVDLDGAQIYGSLAIPASVSGLDSVITHSYISGEVAASSASDSGTPLSVTDSVIDGGASLTGSSHQTASITGSQLSDVAGEGFSTWNTPVTMSCDIVTGDRGGIEIGDGSSITMSDLYGSETESLADLNSDADASHPVDATSDWWGQPGGPEPKQVSGPANTSTPQSSDPACTSTVPQRPSSVTGLTTTPVDHGVALSWTNPDDPTFSGNQVRMVEGDDPVQTPTEGTEVYAGSGDSVTVHGLNPKKHYTFAFFSAEGDALGDGFDWIYGYPRDPLPVTHLTATMGYSQATLNWVPSADSDTTTVICESEGGPVQLDPMSCPALYRGSGNQAVITKLDPQGTFEVWAVDAANNVSPAAYIAVNSTRLDLGSSSAGPPTAAHGQRFELGGGLVGNPPAPDVTISLYQVGTGGVERLVSSSTEPAVGFRFYVHPRRATQYLVKFPPTGATAGSISEVVSAVPQRRLVLHRPRQVAAPNAWVLSGVVAPASGLRRVAIRRWHLAAIGRLIGWARVTSGGHFRLRITVGKSGVLRCYALTPTGSGFSANDSNFATLRSHP